VTKLMNFEDYRIGNCLMKTSSSHAGFVDSFGNYCK
jgi:hypothetical protein